MVSMTVQTSGLAIGDGEKGLHQIKPDEDACGIKEFEFGMKPFHGKDLENKCFEELIHGLEDEDDDSDWEPVEKRLDALSWFCNNCTMVNVKKAVHCDLCGEHRKNIVLNKNFAESNCLSGIATVQENLEAKDTNACVSLGSNSTAIGFDERMLLHFEVDMKSHPHPERPDRIQVISCTLASAGISPGRCNRIPAREITSEELQKAHSLEHIQTVGLTRNFVSGYFTPDTYVNEHSALAARLAAGICADLASGIVLGHSKNGFALVRPPGHHAGVSKAMGFCLHNNAAIAAFSAQVSGALKVLIVDWDVHHGNGTQEIFEENKSVLYISLHRHDGGMFYPGTGAANKVGLNGAEGYCVNIPWSCPGVGDGDYIFAFRYIVMPIALEFNPDIVIISAGFDAARGDPLGHCDVTPAAYAHMTEMLSTLSGGKLLAVLEGGYNLRSISSSAIAVIKVLLGEVASETVDTVPSAPCLETVMEVLMIQMNYWPSLVPIFEMLKSQHMAHGSANGGKQKKRTKQNSVPLWWRWGRKRLLYHVLSKHPSF